MGGRTPEADQCFGLAARRRFVRVAGLWQRAGDAGPDQDTADSSAGQGRFLDPLASFGDPRDVCETVDEPAADRGFERSAPVDQARALAALNPGRRGVKAIFVVVVVVALAAGGLAWWTRPRAKHVPVTNLGVDLAAAAASSGSSDGGPSPAGSAVAGGSVVVAVTGKVRHPGLVRLPAGARVADAIEAAGGALPGTDLSFVNLARPLNDGELVLVGIVPSGALGQAGAPLDQAGAVVGPPVPPGSAGKVNINSAGLAELQTLPGIGPVLARRILEYRAKHGRFSLVTDMRKVEGIGDTRFERLKDLVAV